MLPGNKLDRVRISREIDSDYAGIFTRNKIACIGQRDFLGARRAESQENDFTRMALAQGTHTYSGNNLNFKFEFVVIVQMVSLEKIARASARCNRDHGALM